jgi:hypothetical protein
MTSIIFLMLFLAFLAVSGVALGVFTIWQTRAMAGALQGRTHNLWEESEALARSLEARLNTLTAQVQNLELPPPVTLAPGLPKPGMNVVKRAHALRLHRHGERSEEIARSLDLPRQEVDLLLKVHTIVISNT